jgi:hypothetical protein
MKTQKLFIVCLLAVGMGCKKESDKTSDCKITYVATSAGSTFTLTYNDEGKIATIHSSDSHKDFTYIDNTVYIVTLDKDGNFYQKDSITIDTKGRPLNIRSFSTAVGSTWNNDSFEYNGDDLKSFTRTTSSGATPTITTTTYSNGNPLVLKTGASNIILDYYTDKKLQKGDYLEMATLVQYGISLYPHKNLLKMIASGSEVTNLTYEFNSDGLISKLTATSPTQANVLLYTYECK